MSLKILLFWVTKKCGALNSHDFNFLGTRIGYIEIQEGYCIGNRVGLGLDTIHGSQNPSLQDCAENALYDTRCDGSGYFDAIHTGGVWQCKCVTDSCVPRDSTEFSTGWIVYKAQYVGKNK